MDPEDAAPCGRRLRELTRGDVMRELFVEELVEVTGGRDCPDCWHTSDACCEEGPMDGCCNMYGLDDIIDW